MGIYCVYLRLSFGVFLSLITNNTMNADKLMIKTFYQHLDLQSSGLFWLSFSLIFFLCPRWLYQASRFCEAQYCSEQRLVY